MELVDLLESYPSAHNSRIQRYVTDKHEFAELASPLFEKLKPGLKGQFYNHQKLYQRLMRVYDRLLIMDETGTGKTCSVLGFPEWVHRELIKSKTSPQTADRRLSGYKRAVIIVKNEHLIREFERQLACRCSDGHYETEHVLSSTSTETRERRIRKELKRTGYQFYTYSTFAAYIIKSYGDGTNPGLNQKLIADFHHSIFWVDEAHYILDDSEVEAKLDEVNKMLPRDVIYAQIYRVFHRIPQTKLFLTTATPMTNTTASLGPLMNLLIPEELPRDYDLSLTTPNDLRVLFSSYQGTLQQFKTLSRLEAAKYYQAQFSTDPRHPFPFDSASIDDIEPRIRGLVTYIRGVEAEAQVEDMGSNYQYKLIQENGAIEVNSRIFISRMSHFQSEAYFRAKETERNAFLPSERQASLFVYPDGTWRSEPGSKNGYNKYIKTHASSAVLAVVKHGKKERKIKELKIGEFYATPEFAKEIQVFLPDGKTIDVERTLDNIEKHGCKYAAAIRLMLQPDNVGNCFVYEEYYKGPGTICFATCLKLLGFEHFRGDQSAYESLSTNTDEGTAAVSFCADPLAASVRKIVIDKKPRFVLLSSEATPVQFNNMIELMNDPANLHGEYIKIFITSRVGREGLSVFNVTQRHLLGPEWNEANQDQADARAYRVGGHEALIRWLQEEYRKQGKDPTKAKIKVETYHHAAIPDSGDPNDASDLYMYRYSDAKQRPIARMILILRRCAVTCQINKNRNVRSTDVDGSKACLYDKCDYSCYDYQDEHGAVTIGSDYSTYDLVYAQPEVEKIKRQVINVINQVPSLTLRELVNKIGVEDGAQAEKLVLTALEQLIRAKTIITNRLGYPCYLREDTNRYYLDYSYPDGPSEYDMRQYVTDITLTRPTSLSEILQGKTGGIDVMPGVDLSSVDQVRDYFENIVGNGEEQWNQRIAAIEYMVEQKEKGDAVPAIDILLNCGFVPIFYLPYPEARFKEIEKSKANTHKRGRPRKDPTKYDLQNKPLEDKYLKFYPETAPSPKQYIYVHTLKSLIPQGNVKYEAVPNFLRGARAAPGNDHKILDNSELRIYDVSARRWDNASLDALEVLIPWVQRAIQSRITQRFTDYYDLEINGKFRVARVNLNIENNVKKARGAICTDKSAAWVINIMYQLFLDDLGQETLRERMPDPSDEEAVQRDWELRLLDPTVQKLWRGQDYGSRIFDGPGGLPFGNITKMEYYIAAGEDIDENADGSKDNEYLCDLLQDQFHQLGLVASTDIVDCLRSRVSKEVEQRYEKGERRVNLLPSITDISSRPEPKIIRRRTEMGTVFPSQISVNAHILPSPTLEVPRLGLGLSGTRIGDLYSLPQATPSVPVKLPSPPLAVPTNIHFKALGGISSKK